MLLEPSVYLCSTSHLPFSLDRWIKLLIIVRKSSTSTSGASSAEGNERRGIAREFMDFIVHNKAWWMTPIILVLALMVAFILFAESSPVLPFIYTVI